jgi:hypothetical protein
VGRGATSGVLCLPVSSGVSCGQLWSQLSRRNCTVVFSLVQNREAFHGLGVQDVAGFDSD